MYCVKCGYKISYTSKFCTHCGSMISQNNQISQPVNNNQAAMEVDVKANKEENKNATILCIMSLICSHGIPIVFSNSNVPNLLLNIISLFSLVLVIVARVKYPNSKFAKVLLYIYIVEIVLAAILFVVFLITCDATCGRLRDIG